MWQHDLSSVERVLLALFEYILTFRGQIYFRALFVPIVYRISMYHFVRPVFRHNKCVRIGAQGDLGSVRKRLPSCAQKLNFTLRHSVLVIRHQLDLDLLRPAVWHLLCIHLLERLQVRQHIFVLDDAASEPVRFFDWALSNVAPLIQLRLSPNSRLYYGFTDLRQPLLAHTFIIPGVQPT